MLLQRRMPRLNRLRLESLWPKGRMSPKRLTRAEGSRNAIPAAS
jgi:hypothetical protein